MNRFRTDYCVVFAFICTSLTLISHFGLHAADPRTEKGQAETILHATGIEGGLVVHLGCGDGKLTTALRVGDRYLVHGLDQDAERITAARQHIEELGLYGKVSMEKFTGERLPYSDNLVNLVVAEQSDFVSHDEIMRVLCPGGVLYAKMDDVWVTTVKERPPEMDEWTHFLHGPDNNAVAKDTVVGPPDQLQWVGGPKWARGHEVLATISMVVSAGGRVFYVADEGPTASVDLPSKWMLVARDAFNGVLLWKRPIPKWESEHRPFRSGPTHLPRRLVAIGNTVYVTLGFGEPLVALNAATGEIKKKYEATTGTEEILYLDGRLYLVIGDPADQRAADLAVRRGQPLPPVKKQVVAIDSVSGEKLWGKSDSDTADLFSQTLAVANGRAFLQNTRAVICLDGETGEQVWRVKRLASLKRPAWSVPTLVVYNDIVLSADRKPTGEPFDDSKPQRVEWTVSFAGGQSPPGELIAYSAKTGEQLWSTKCREGYNAPVDLLVADGLLWTGDLVRARDPGITQALDPATGEVKRTRPNDQQFFSPGMSHHRCYRNRATENFVLLGRSGVEFMDLKSGKAYANHWIRGTCQFGVLPANGLTYVPPHSCACYAKTKLNGFNAVAAKRPSQSAAKPQPRLQKGPAFGAVSDQKLAVSDQQSAVSKEDWPTFRHDNLRSGGTKAAVPTKLKETWQAELGGKLSSLVVAGGQLFVARMDTHSIHAIDAATGESSWSFTAGGKIDSPPTIHKGLVLFGSVDGWLYCLRAKDGQLAWRFRAGPEERRIMIDGSLESAWPIHGSVLVQNDAVYFAAGRSSFLDGGIYVLALDPFSGKLIRESRVSGRDPKTGEQPKDAIKGFDMPGGLPDVLSSDGEFIFMRDLKFDDQCTQCETGGTHLFCPTGFLDDSWWHRSYWIYGTDYKAGWGGWDRAGNTVPAGRLLVFDDKSIYGFGRNYYPRGNAGQWKTGEYYRIFAASKQLKPVEPAPKNPKNQKRNRRQRPKSRVDYQWSFQPGLEARAMVLTRDAVFIAGPHGATHRSLDAFKGNEGISLQSFATKDGSAQQKLELNDMPVFDGLAATKGRLYLATRSGKVICFAGK